MVPKSVYLRAHTLARMRPRQIAGVGKRKLRELLVPRLPVNFDERYDSRVPACPSTRYDIVGANTELLRDSLDDETRDRYREQAATTAAGAPSFLNRSLDIATERSVGWYDERLEELPRLWRLKLYAFQPLSSLVRGHGPDEPAAKDHRETFDTWVRDWMDSVEIGGHSYLRRAWTPYAVSLRVRHWIRYLAWRRSVTPGLDEAFETAFLRAVYNNALFLRAHIERDVGGNHLIENGAALAVAGLFFEERDFLDVGTSVLTESAKHQFLDGGCHFERSPMYHVACLVRLLTVRDLLRRAGRPIPEPVRTAVESAVTFLRVIQPPDDRIPLLNDAVYGQTLPLPACLRYAEKAGVPAATVHSRETAGTSGERDGYHWLRTDAGRMLVDGGPVGPRHLPGHAHSDLLTLLLWLDGDRVVTDTGTFDYERGPRRTYARGATSHNTVRVNGQEPIPLGRRFLMGPQPELETRTSTGDISLFEGSYEANPFAGERYTHHRAVYAADRWWLVWDAVFGDLSSIESRLHLHPDVEARTDGTAAVLTTGTGAEDTVNLVSGNRVRTVSGEYFPQFGKANERPVLELSAATASRPVATCGYLVGPGDVQSASAETSTDGTSPVCCVVDGERRQLPRTELSPE